MRRNPRQSGESPDAYLRRLDRAAQMGDPAAAAELAHATGRVDVRQLQVLALVEWLRVAHNMARVPATAASASTFRLARVVLAIDRAPPSHMGASWGAGWWELTWPRMSRDRPPVFVALVEGAESRVIGLRSGGRRLLGQRSIETAWPGFRPDAGAWLRRPAAYVSAPGVEVLPGDRVRVPHEVAELWARWVIEPHTLAETLRRGPRAR